MNSGLNLDAFFWTLGFGGSLLAFLLGVSFGAYLLILGGKAAYGQLVAAIKDSIAPIVPAKAPQSWSE